MKTAPFRWEGRCCCIRRGAVVYWGGGAMWASPPTNGLSRVRLYNVSPSVALRATPPSQREAKISAPVGAWTGGRIATPVCGLARNDGGKAGAEKRCVGAGFYPARLPLRRPAGDTSLTEGGKGFPRLRARREGQSPSPTKLFYSSAFSSVGRAWLTYSSSGLWGWSLM